MPKTGDQDLFKGKQYCFKLLKIRERSTKELCDRLKERKYPPKAINDIIAYLSDIHLLDDEKFTCNWIKWRINNGYGKHRIIAELKQKGIDDEVVAKALNEALTDYDEEACADHLAQKRVARYRGLELPIRQRRLYGYLVRKGFSQNIVFKIVHSYDNT